MRVLSNYRKIKINGLKMSESFRIILILGMSLIAPNQSQVTGIGGCPNIVGKPIDFTQYQGTWYEIARYFFLPEAVSKCIFVHYFNYRRGKNRRHGKIDKVIQKTDKITGMNWLSTVHGNVERFQEKSMVTLLSHLPMPFINVARAPLLRIKYPFFVLDTDYKTYGIEWSCWEEAPGTGESLVHTQNLWIVSRKRTLPLKTKMRIFSKLKKFGLDPAILIQTDQSRCPKPELPDMLHKKQSQNIIKHF